MVRCATWARLDDTLLWAEGGTLSARKPCRAKHARKNWRDGARRTSAPSVMMHAISMIVHESTSCVLRRTCQLSVALTCAWALPLQLRVLRGCARRRRTRPVISRSILAWRKAARCGGRSERTHTQEAKRKRMRTR
jgi:hypothetical protein